MPPFGFDLGFKLNLWWRRQQREGELPDCDVELYELLAAAGFGYFEASVGPCRTHSELDLLAAEARACADAGLTMSVHPYLPPPCNPAAMGTRPEPASTIDRLLAAAASVRDLAGEPVRVVLHPATLSLPQGADLAAMRPVLLARSRDYVALVADRASRRPGVRPMIEHQLATMPGESIIRIGDTADELLRVVDEADAGVCWDTGHYLLAVDRHGQPAQPPERFVRRVEHVHLHAVADGIDHRVIEAGSRALPAYVRMLADAGFSGSLTLEYSAVAILASGGFRAVIDRSLDVLRGYLS
jgi:sugar phosphate isomerase/epimerase